MFLCTACYEVVETTYYEPQPVSYYSDVYYPSYYYPVSAYYYY